MGPNADGSINLTLYTKDVDITTLPQYYQDITGLAQIFPTFTKAVVMVTTTFNAANGSSIDISGILNPNLGNPDSVIIDVAHDGNTYQTSDPEIVNS